MINYQDTNYTILQKCNRLNDGVKLFVTAPTSTQYATLTLTTANGDTYTEKHALHKGKSIFDLSEYFRESMPLGVARLMYDGSLPYLRFARYNSTSNLVKNVVAPNAAASSVVFAFDDKEVKPTTSDLEVVYGYTKFEDSAHLHLFNPNFETIAEFMPTTAHTTGTDLQGYTLFGLCYNRNNGNEISWYRHPLGSKNKVRQVLLNDYWDTRYNNDGIMLDFITNEEATETISYIVDTRTKGAFLRFLDSNGNLQQLLLDIESQESTYEDGDLLTYYDGGARYYETEAYNYQLYCTGNGQEAKRAETNILHASLSNMPKGLTADIKALILSPIVLLYRGKTEEGVQKWERVRVVPNGTITEETKKAQISVKVDIYPIFENSVEV